MRTFLKVIFISLSAFAICSEIEPHSSSAEPDTTKTKKLNKNKKKKVVEKLDSSMENRKSDSEVMAKSPVPELGSDLKPSSEK